ncbi:MAG: hypothetical protein R3D85_13330 [Paracoccaceae bacterium]
MTRPLARPALAALLALAAAPLAAQTVLPGDHVVAGKLCVGQQCASGEVISAQDSLKINGNTVSILFEDGSDGTGFPGRDWRLLVNDGGPESGGAIDRFSVQDVDAGTFPFTIEGSAPENALWIDSNGNVGLGTRFPLSELHLLSGFNPSIRLERDTSSGFQAQTWNIGPGGTEFRITDVTASTVPFAIARNAPDRAIRIANTGNLLIGEPLVQGAGLVVSDTSSADLFLEIKDISGASPTIVRGYQVQATANYFSIYEVAPGITRTPFRIAAEADNASVTLAAGGRIGLFAPTPQAALHLRRSDGTAQAYVQEASATTEPRTLLNLRNNGRPEIVMGNTDTGGEWSFGAGTNFILKQGALGSTSSAKTKLFEVTGTGNATLAGSLTTGGTTCGGGCDRVFTEQAIIPARDYAAAMWTQGFLPHVGPTPEGAPLNVSEKLGGMLNALEHAHVFIADLSAENAALAAQVAAERTTNANQAAQIAALTARLDALEGN